MTRHNRWAALAVASTLLMPLTSCATAQLVHDALNDEAVAAPLAPVVATTRPGSVATATPQASTTKKQTPTASPTAIASPTPVATQPSSATGLQTVAATPRPTRAATGAVALGAHERPSRGGVSFPPTARGPLSGYAIVVDPGHNGVYVPRIAARQVDAGGGRRKDCNTTGTANARLSEHALNWKVASRLVADLRARGATVWLTRPDDVGVGPCVNERAAIGNRADADLLVSIHADGNTSGSARGFHIITSTAMAGGPEAEARSMGLARVIRGGLMGTAMPPSTYVGGGSGIVARSDIAGLNLSQIPGVMLEMGNMRHPKDAALFSQNAFHAQVARVLADAVTSSLD